MGIQAGDCQPDWQKLPQDIRLLCYEAALALEEGRGLDKLRPRPLPNDLQPARDDLIRTLVDLGWQSLPASGRGTIPTEKSLYDLIYGLSRRGHTLGLAWGAILELIEAGAAEPFVDLAAGEGCIFLRMVPERIEEYRRSMTPIEKPKWDEGSRTLSYGTVVCKKFRRFAEIQYAILNKFQEMDWPQSVSIPRRMSRQAVQDLNESLTPDCPIRFRYSDKTKSISWESK